MKKILVVVDMQNDFIDGSLGTKEAQDIVEKVIHKIGTYEEDCIYATLDTHDMNYLESMEGKYLPVEHCIKGTIGWEIPNEIRRAMSKAMILEKPTFGSGKLADLLSQCAEKEKIEIELIGVCTDICVVTNALLLKTKMPEVKISVDSSCCAGVTPESHNAALETMKMCQIEVN